MESQEQPVHPPNVPDQPQAGAIKPMEFVEPEDGILFVYANHVRVGTTAFDLRIRLGELVDAGDDGTFTIEERVHATMSWIKAKQLMETLKESVDAYERTNGPINANAKAPGK